MIKFIHITSLQSALSIMRTGKFRPVKGTDSDAGLNGLQLGRLGWDEQSFTGSGAGLLFEWTGPVEIGTGSSPDNLYDQMPHRIFIPGGTQRHLRLTGFIAAPQTWDRHHVDLPWYCIGQNRRARARRRAIVELHAEIDGLLESNRQVSVL